MMRWIITISLNIRSMFKNSNGEEVRASDYAHFPPMMNVIHRSHVAVKLVSGIATDVVKKVVLTYLQKSSI